MMNKFENKTKKIKKGDKVLAITGNHRGQTGTVLAIHGSGAVVQGLNVKKKHVKKSQNTPNGGIVEMERPINISNLVVCNESGQPLKLKMHVTDKHKKKNLVYHEHGKDVIYRTIRTHKAVG